MTMVVIETAQRRQPLGRLQLSPREPIFAADARLQRQPRVGPSSSLASCRRKNSATICCMSSESPGEAQKVFFDDDELFHTLPTQGSILQGVYKHEYCDEHSVLRATKLPGEYLGPNPSVASVARLAAHGSVLALNFDMWSVVNPGSFIIYFNSPGTGGKLGVPWRTRLRKFG
jgi:hypothetical protein